MNVLIFQNGIKHADFIVYNPLNIALTDEIPIYHEITLDKNSFWQNIKSLTWSSNCRFFFVISNDQIIIGNTHSDEAFLCSNLSQNIFNDFLQTFKHKNKQ